MLAVSVSRESKAARKVPRMLQDGAKGTQGGSGTVPRMAQEGLKTAQETSKTAPEGLNIVQEAPKTAQWPPNTPQQGSKRTPKLLSRERNKPVLLGTRKFCLMIAFSGVRDSKAVQEVPKTAQKGPQKGWFQGCPRGPQDGPAGLHNVSGSPQDDPRGLQDCPRSPEDGPRAPPRRPPKRPKRTSKKLSRCETNC